MKDNGVDVAKLSLQVVRIQTEAGVHGPVNSYALRLGDQQILVDPAPGLVLPAHVAEPDLVLVTHVQEENCGGAAHFAGANLAVPADAAYLCAGLNSYRSRTTTWEPPWDWTGRGCFEGHLAGALNERPPQGALQVQRHLKEGDTVGPFHVLETAGHGKNALSFLWDHEGTLCAFCGDLVCGDGQLWNWFDADWDYGAGAGFQALLQSARKLRDTGVEVLFPTHGAPIFSAGEVLGRLMERLEAVLTACEPSQEDLPALNFPETPGPVEGWRRLSEHLYQWKTGNCALLVSRAGVGLLVDAGLCHWVPEPERSRHHEEVMHNIMEALGLETIEVVLATHYHGDHTEHIGALHQRFGTWCLTLDVVAPVLGNPAAYNLAAALPWYGTACGEVVVHETVADGTVFRWREYEIEAFHLAGQTFYHAGYAVKVDGVEVIFVGDALYNWEVKCEPVLTYNDNEPVERGWVYALKQIEERHAELIVCGHGGAIANPAPLLRQKLAAWQEQLGRYDALNPREDRRLFFDPFYRPKER